MSEKQKQSTMPIAIMKWQRLVNSKKTTKYGSFSSHSTA